MIVGAEGMSASELQNLTKTSMSNSNPYFSGKKAVDGNMQYHTNLMAQKNYSETSLKDVYYNEKTRTLVYYYKESDKTVTLPGIGVEVHRFKIKVPANNEQGYEIKIVKGYKVLADREKIEALAEQRQEETGSTSNNDSVPDNDGSSDTTRLFEVDDDI